MFPAFLKELLYGDNYGDRETCKNQNHVPNQATKKILNIEPKKTK